MADEGTEQPLVRIKPFNGTEFNIWESNLKLMLEQHSVLSAISENPPNPNVDPAKAAEFVQNDIKARFIITQAVADHMQIFIKDQKTARGMLESLQADFGHDGIGVLGARPPMHVWTDEETSRLLSFYCQLLPELEAGNIATKDKMMVMIEKKMGGIVTAGQCVNRIKSLQRGYKLHKSGKSQKPFPRKYRGLLEAMEKGTLNNSSIWIDPNGEHGSMVVDSEDLDHANAANQLYEATTLIPQGWSEEETVRLLDMYNQLKPELVVGSISSQEKVMEIIAEEMGGHLTPVQCLNHFKNLRAAYKKYKKNPGSKKFKYADAMEAIEGGNPDNSVAEEANDEGHEVVIVGHAIDTMSDGDMQDSETEAAVDFISGDTVESPDNGNDLEKGDQRMFWCRKSTLKLLSLVENYSSVLGRHPVKTRSKMWSLISRRMDSKVTPEQCACKWRNMEKSYKKAVENGRGHMHLYSAQVKSILKLQRQSLLPNGSKLGLTNDQNSNDLTFLLENADNSIDGDGTLGLDEITASPRVTEVFSLFPNEADESEGDNLWSHENTIKLIELFKQLKGLVGTSKLRTHKKMWQVIADHMGGPNANQCENKWRVLERKYRKHLSIASSQFFKGKGMRAFEYYPQMHAILNWSAENVSNSCPEPNPEFAGVQLASGTMSAPPMGIMASSSFESSTKRDGGCFSEEPQDDDVNEDKDKMPYKWRLLDRIRRDKKAYYSQMVSIHRERLEIEKGRLEELKRKNKILERSVSLGKRI